MKTLKLLIFCLLFAQWTNGQSQKLTSEDLFKNYLVSEKESVAKIIINGNDSLYSLYCQAMLSADFPEKINYFTKFISLNPKYGIAEAFLNRGIVYTLSEKYDSALADYNNSIQLNSNILYTFYFRGATYKHFEQYDNAIDDFSKVIKMKPDFLLAYYMRGSCFLDQKKCKMALIDINKVIDLDKNYAPAFILRGLIFDEMGEYKKAISDWNEAKEMNNKDTIKLDKLIENAKKKMKDKK